jgi:ketosteroid isomerase-like protein
MPDRSVVEAFAAMVEAGDHVEAIRQFYTEDASMQENDAPPRVGRDALAAREKAVLSAQKSVVSTRLSPILIDGDEVAIRWRFEFTPLEGKPMTFEEVAWQTWRGDKIWREVFIYDPAQMGR